ncbi:MAG: right-handed parallel beta-helix repeat-containing protein [Candidatus Pacearchaeota archaeon]|jgi:hypothetical protein
MTEARKKIIFFITSFFLIFFLLFFISSVPNLTLFSIKNTEDILSAKSEIEMPEISEGSEVNLNGYKFSNSSGVIISTEPKINCHWKNPENDDGWKVCEAIFQIDLTGKNELELKNPNIQLKFEKPDDVKDIEILYSKDYTLTYENLQDIEISEEKIKGLLNQEKELFSINEDNKIFRKNILKSEGNNIRDVKRNKLEIINNKIKKRSFYNFVELKNLELKEDLIKEKDYNKSEEIVETNQYNEGNLTFESLNESHNQNIEENNTNNDYDDSDEISNLSIDDKNISEYNEILNEEEDSSGSNEILNEDEIIDESSEENSNLKEGINGKEDNIKSTEKENVEEINNEGNKVINEKEGNKDSEDEIESEGEGIGTDEGNGYGESEGDGELKSSFISGLVVKMFDESNEVEKPLAILVRFEIPKYDSNSFDFLISEGETQAKIDPDISECGDLNTINGIYVLDRDFESTETCFTISADNITLDCNNHKIGHSLESPGYGIYSSYSNTRILNCIIYEANDDITPTRNIFLSDSSNSQIINNTLNISGTSSYNLYIEGGINNLVLNNDIKVYSEDSYGFFADYTEINLSNNNITTYATNNYGGYLNSITNSYITNNFFNASGNSSFPILIQSSELIDMNENQILSFGNYSYLIYIDSSNFINLTENNITSYGLDSYDLYIVNYTNNSNFESNQLNLNNFDSATCSILMQNSFGNNFINNSIFISGGDSSGICFNQVQNFTIRDNNIIAYLDSIYLVDSLNGNIINNNLTNFGLDNTGLYVSIGSNFSVVNNSFYSNNDSSYGFYLEYLTESNISGNYFFIFHPNSYSIYLTSESDYTKLDSNSITSIGFQSYGASLSASSYVNFTNNNISCYSLDGKCVYTSEIYYSNILNNSIFIFNETPYGLYINTDSSYNFFQTNNLFSDVDYSSLLVIENSINNNFSENNITQRGNNANGIYLSSCLGSTNYFYGERIYISGNDSKGINFYLSNANSIFEKLIFEIIEESAYSIFVTGSNNNFIIKDSNIGNYSQYGFYVSDSIDNGVWNFINTSIENIFWDSTSNAFLNYSFYINVYLNNTSGIPIPNANVSLKDNEGNLISLKTTDNDGRIYFIASEYIMENSETINYLSNYSIEINFMNESANFIINLSGNKEVFYQMDISEENIISYGGSGNQEILSIPSKKNEIVNNTNSIIPPKKIKPKKVTLFDISLRLLKKEINIGKKISGVIGLINVALPGKVNANLYYKITDMNDNLYIEEEEIVPVETQTEFIKEFDTSKLNEGEYKIFVKLDYLGQTEPAEAQETFIIKKGIGEGVANLIQGKLFYIGFLSLILTGILSILLHFYELKIRLKQK